MRKRIDVGQRSYVLTIDLWRRQNPVWFMVGFERCHHEFCCYPIGKAKQPECMNCGKAARWDGTP